MDDNTFDLVVIGSGPAGQKGAIAAAKMGKRVAVIDRNDMIGGVCLHAGTIPSKTLRSGGALPHGLSAEVVLRTGLLPDVSRDRGRPDVPGPHRHRSGTGHGDGPAPAQRCDPGERLGPVRGHPYASDGQRPASQGRAYPHRLRHPFRAGSGDPLRRPQDHGGGRLRPRGPREDPPEHDRGGGGESSAWSMPRCSPPWACASPSSSPGTPCWTSWTRRSSRRSATTCAAATRSSGWGRRRSGCGCRRTAWCGPNWIAASGSPATPCSTP